jgi:uncharacterized protein
MGLDVLSPDEVRRITLRSQGFLGVGGRRGGVPGMLSRLGAVQLDTISVLARSHELVAYARLGPLDREKIEQAYWNPRVPATFEYWSHAACILPLAEWAFHAFRRRWFRARGLRWHRVSETACKQILARLATDGPLTATELGGAKGGGPWWDWSEVKVAAEWLLDIGDVICARRTGWRRVYDLPQRVLPPDQLETDRTDEECLAHLLSVSARALGVITKPDITDYQRLAPFLKTRSIEPLAEAAGLTPVTIAGVGKPVKGWADPAALAAETTAGRERHRVTLLSPFDSLVWDRKRTLRMFGFEHSLEAYVPKDKRVHGYFTMPLLAGGRLRGRVDPAREGSTLVVRKLSLDRASAAGPMAQALREAASWVGCDDVRVDQVASADHAARLAVAMARA